MISMPYANKEIQKQYNREWEEKNKENRIWSNFLWHKDHQEYKNQLDRESRERHKAFYNWLSRFKRRLKKLSK